MTTTRLKVVVKRGAGADEKVLTAEHSDSCRQGPTIGPFTVGDGCVYFWPGHSYKGEPVVIPVGASLVVTCEVDD